MLRVPFDRTSLRCFGTAAAGRTGRALRGLPWARGLTSRGRTLRSNWESPRTDSEPQTHVRSRSQSLLRELPSPASASGSQHRLERGMECAAPTGLFEPECMFSQERKSFLSDLSRPPREAPKRRCILQCALPHLPYDGVYSSQASLYRQAARELCGLPHARRFPAGVPTLYEPLDRRLFSGCKAETAAVNLQFHSATEP